MPVIFSAASRRDLLAIAVFIAADNPVRAQTFIDELTHACKGLMTQAERFPIIAGHEARGYRLRPHGNYAIIYRVERGAVRIFRVLHTARNLRRILGD